MQHKSVSPLVLVGIVVGAIVFSAIAFGPTGFFRPSNPRTSPDGPGHGEPALLPMAFDRPSWQVGDSWTYESSAMAGDDVGGPVGVTATLTRTVVSADDSIVNVTSEGSFHARWTLSPTPDGSEAGGSIMLGYRMFFRDATVGGYTWYRASDLATIKEVRMIQFGGTFEIDSGVYQAAYTARVETTFDPALDVWSFPLEADEAWTARSTATVHAIVDWSVEQPNGPWRFGKDITFTRPIEVLLRSGVAEDVVTPAGSFPSIPVRIGLPHIEVLGSLDRVEIAAGLEEDMPVPREHTTEAWFSGTAKNVVKVTFSTGGYRLDLALTQYDVG
jgi:hypothetical protein